MVARNHLLKYSMSKNSISSHFLKKSSNSSKNLQLCTRIHFTFKVNLVKRISTEFDLVFEVQKFKYHKGTDLCGSTKRISHSPVESNLKTYFTKYYTVHRWSGYNSGISSAVFAFSREGAYVETYIGTADQS